MWRMRERMFFAHGNLGQRMVSAHGKGEGCHGHPSPLDALVCAFAYRAATYSLKSASLPGTTMSPALIFSKISRVAS